MPFGSIGLTLFGIDLVGDVIGAGERGNTRRRRAVRDPAYWRIIADLALIGIFGGFYIVLCMRSSRWKRSASRSRTIAGNNILNALFVVAAALAIALFTSSSPYQLILATALLNAAVALLHLQARPEFLMRFMAWLVIHSVYRLEKKGLDQSSPPGVRPHRAITSPSIDAWCSPQRARGRYGG